MGSAENLYYVDSYGGYSWNNLADMDANSAIETDTSNPTNFVFNDTYVCPYTNWAEWMDDYSGPSVQGAALTASMLQ